MESSQAAGIYVTEGTGTARNVTIIGQIESGDEEKFRRLAVATIKNGYWIGMVRIFSPGGNVEAAIGIGEQIRSMRASTIAPMLMDQPSGLRLCITDIFSPPNMHTLQFDTRTGSGNRNCDCASACFLIWAAGVGRQGNVVGMHRPFFNPKEFAGLTAEEANRRYAVVIDHQKTYLNKMGIPPYFSDLLFAHSSQQMRYLTKQELQIFPPLEPGTDELRLARCGQRPGNNASEAIRIRYYNCTQAIYEEASRAGNAEYLRRYDR
jgi:hypothetical protein